MEPLEMEALRSRGFASQFGQDVVLDALFRGIGVDQGFFVDVGAHDGITGSNSLFFERERGWRGICIEPLPGPFAALKSNRRAVTINCAVGEYDGEADFVVVGGYAEMLSGLESELDPRHAARIDDEVAQHGGTRQTVKVPVRRLDELLAEHGAPRVDLLSVDVEGAELSVLRSLDLSVTPVVAVAVETNYAEDSVERYLVERSNLRRLLRLGPDDLYVDLVLARDLLLR
jgi:FkbM family methyltransferase